LSRISARPATAAELRELIAALERSGMAERRQDARDLLETSRQLLRAQQEQGRASLGGRRVVGRAAGMLASIGQRLLDALAAIGVGVAALGGMLGGLEPVPALAMGAGGMTWAGLRAPALRDAVAEAGRVVWYHLAWAGDWFAEAFSPPAAARLEARHAGRGVMARWRYHRRLLSRPATFADVEETLRIEYGAASASALLAIADGLKPAPRARLRALRWSALISAFGRLTASGALARPARPPAPEPMPGALPAQPDLPPPLPIAPESPARIQRRQDLRELIRRKRADITTAYSWKLKSEAEIAERERHVDVLKAEIAAIEHEMAALETI